MDNQKSIVISSTFAAEPLREPISFWLDRLKLSARLLFAPELQLFQNLLDARSPLNSNAAGLNVVLLRWQDIDAGGRDGDRPFSELIGALRASIRPEIPLLIVTCPASPESIAADRIDTYADWDRRLARLLDGNPNRWVAAAAEWQALYPVTSPYEAGGDELACLPYSDATFAVLGTLIARKFHMLTTTPYKVIAVDCDDTLWDGVCGEAAPQGLGLRPSHIELQQFLVSQVEQGCLVCLCSKNNPEDVEAVFRERPDMPLRWEHFAACKLNWKPKPENVLALAGELGLGTDSFIFIDDNPIECEVMRQSLPKVLTLALPPDRNCAPQFLRRVWAFDRPAATAEDKRRLHYYQQEREREQLHQKSATLEEFIAGLELNVEFQPLDEEGVRRASQLTFRVNQFNASTIRRSEAELLRLLGDRSLDGWAVGVSDRFGAYGVVGLVLLSTAPDSLRVDSFLLSCRALGRGVEHRIIVEIGRRAKSLGLDRIDVLFVPSGKNQPAGEFLESEFGDCDRPGDVGVEYRIPVERALSVQYRASRKGKVVSLAGDGVAAMQEEKVDTQETPAITLAWIATDLASGDAIHQAMMHLRRKSKASWGSIPPRTAAEREIAEIWAETLGVASVGMRDNFFQLGGDSLAMVRVILRVHELTGCELPVQAFFQSPTIEEQLLRFPIGAGNGES
jgi:FkbH-like protein